MGSDLFGAALSGDVLGVRQLGPAGGSSKSEKIVGDHRHSASCALLPRRVGGGIDDHLADSSPAGVMRITARYEKPRERIGDALGVRIGRVDIEVPQRRTDLVTAVNCSREVTCGPLRSVSRIVDQSTVLAARGRSLAPTGYTVRGRYKGRPLDTDARIIIRLGPRAMTGLRRPELSRRVRALGLH